MDIVYVIIEIDRDNSLRRWVRSYHPTEASAHHCMGYWPGTHYQVERMTEDEAIARGSRPYMGTPIDS